MLSVSTMTTLTLMAQVGNLIASAVLSDRSATSIIIATLVIEITAAALIISLFNPQSEFTRSAQEITKGATASTGGRSRGPSVGRPSVSAGRSRGVSGGGSVRGRSETNEIKLRVRRPSEAHLDHGTVNPGASIAPEDQGSSTSGSDSPKDKKASSESASVSASASASGSKASGDASGSGSGSGSGSSQSPSGSGSSS